MVDNLFSIEGKVIIITGTGRGIGHKLATELAKYSATIYSLPAPVIIITFPSIENK